MTFRRTIRANEVPKDDEIWDYSNPNKVYRKGLKLGITVFRSDKPNKKYMVLNDDEKWIHFGQMDYEDYTKHKDKERRERFLKRSSHWRNLENIYSPAFLSRELLW